MENRFRMGYRILLPSLQYALIYNKYKVKSPVDNDPQVPRFTFKLENLVNKPVANFTEEHFLSIHFYNLYTIYDCLYFDYLDLCRQDVVVDETDAYSCTFYHYEEEILEYEVTYDFLKNDVLSYYYKNKPKNLNIFTKRTHDQYNYLQPSMFKKIDFKETLDRTLTNLVRKFMLSMVRFYNKSFFFLHAHYWMTLDTERVMNHYWDSGCKWYWFSRRGSDFLEKYLILLITKNI